MTSDLYDVYDPTQDDGSTALLVRAITPEQAASKACVMMDDIEDVATEVRVVCVSPRKKNEWTRYLVSASPVKVAYTATKVEN